MASNLLATLLLVAMPGAASSFLLLVVRPGAPSSVLAPSMFLPSSQVEILTLPCLQVCRNLQQSLLTFLASSSSSMRQKCRPALETGQGKGMG